MECLLGIQGKDFVLLAADTIRSRSIVKVKYDQDKMFKIGQRMLLAVSGEAGDTVRFAEFISKNMQLYKMKNGYEMSLCAAANYARDILSSLLRTVKYVPVSALIAGVDYQGPSLYFLDYLGTMIKVPFAAHGLGSMFTLSIMDRFYKPGMRQDEAIHLLKMCMNEVQTRFVNDTSQFMIRVVSKEAGVDDMGLFGLQPAMMPPP